MQLVKICLAYEWFLITAKMRGVIAQIHNNLHQ